MQHDNGPNLALVVSVPKAASNEDVRVCWDDTFCQYDIDGEYMDCADCPYTPKGER